MSAIVVGYADPDATRRAVESLLAGTAAPVEVLVIDNHPTSPLAATAWGDARVRLLHHGENLGYTRACNLAASQARGDWLFFLNPDARAAPACLASLLAAARPEDAVLGAQILLPDGRINAGANPLHLTGISWAGGYGLDREHGGDRQVAAVSGAALLARARAYTELDGMCERFFLYVDDADLCWRARLAGWTVRFCPEAIVHHEYEFDKGREKWFWLERNRLWAVAANYSGPALWLLAPMLLAAEAAVIALAVRGGWVPELSRAWASDARGWRELRSWRRRVQAGRRVPDSALLGLMAKRFDTPLLASPGARLAGPLLDVYAAGVRALLRAVGA